MGRKGVLVVDDELNYRLFLKTLLEAEGHEVIIARNGLEGWEAVQTRRPELIVLDVMMPHQGGVELYRRLKSDSSRSSIPVVMLSAVEAKTFAHALAMLGVTGPTLPEPVDFVQKPVKPERLLAVVRKVLNGPAGLEDTALARAIEPRSR